MEKKKRRKGMRCEFKIQEYKNKTAQQPNDIIIQSNMNINSAICYLFGSRLNVSFQTAFAWYLIESAII